MSHKSLVKKLHSAVVFSLEFDRCDNRGARLELLPNSDG